LDAQLGRRALRRARRGILGRLDHHRSRARRGHQRGRVDHPAFFPDNSGFVFHGGGALFCEQSVLLGTPSRITFTEPGCAAVSGVGLYEHIGTSLAGGDYWAVSGDFTSDDGGHGVTHGDPMAAFGAGTVTLTAMITPGRSSGLWRRPGWRSAEATGHLTVVGLLIARLRNGWPAERLLAAAPRRHT
jgi:hypothetical protein